jgi:hypothetical protein
MELDYIDIDGIKLGLYQKGPVGAGVSCGADSAIVLYILMSNINTHIHIYNMMAHQRRPALEKHFDDVVATCSKLTGNTNYTVHKTYAVPDESAELYINILTTALDTKECDIVYLGLTSFPPIEELSTWPDQQPDWHNKFRANEIEHPLFGFSIPVNLATDFSTVPLTVDGRVVDALTLDERAYIPFFNHDKQDIAKLYRALGVEDTLLPVTRSCETDSHIGSHCGTCWWCRERRWAFGYVDNKDENGL